MKVLITGGAGFIGSHIVSEVVNQGHEVVVIDNFSTGKKSNVKYDSILYEKDIISDSVNKVFMKERPNYVIHLAAQIDTQKSIEKPVQDAKINIIGFLNILECCRQYNVKKIICASSAAVYGEPYYLPIDEKHPLNPDSCYGISKSILSKYLMLYHQLCGLKFNVLRYSNVYGPRQNVTGEGGVIAKFVENNVRNIASVIYGEGSQTRDFIFVRDIAKATIKALTLADNEIINISTNTQTSINELFQVIKYLTKSTLEPKYTEARKGDILHSVLSNDKAKRMLNWEPNWDIESGLKETIYYYTTQMKY